MNTYATYAYRHVINILYAVPAGGNITCTLLLRENVIMIIRMKEKKRCGRALYSIDFLVMDEVKARKLFLAKMCTFVL